jgi:DNA-binding transcriptional ArsR family regulator
MIFDRAGMIGKDGAASHRLADRFDLGGVNRTKPADLARTLSALADPIRLRMLNLLADRDVSLNDFLQVLSLKPQIVSKHLSCLRGGELVATCRKNRTHYYALRWHTYGAKSELLRVILASLKTQPEMQTDVALLKAIHRRERKARNQRKIVNAESTEISAPCLGNPAIGERLSA